MFYNDETIAYQYVVDSMVKALTDMKKILSTTKRETLEKTIEHMTGTLPNMRHIPAASNLEAMQKTIKNMDSICPCRQIEQQSPIQKFFSKRLSK